MTVRQLEAFHQAVDEEGSVTGEPWLFEHVCFESSFDRDRAG